MVLLFQALIAGTTIASGSVLVGIGWGVWTLAIIRKDWLKFLQIAVVVISTIITVNK